LKDFLVFEGVGNSLGSVQLVRDPDLTRTSENAHKTPSRISGGQKPLAVEGSLNDPAVFLSVSRTSVPVPGFASPTLVN